MRNFIGWLCCWAGIGLACVLGVAVLISGAIDVRNGAAADPTKWGSIAWGLTEMFVLASLAAAAIAIAFVSCAQHLFDVDRQRKLARLLTLESQRELMRRKPRHG